MRVFLLFMTFMIQTSGFLSTQIFGNPAETTPRGSHQATDSKQQLEIIQKAEKLMPEYLDSAFTLLTAISNADQNDDNFVKAKYFNVRGLYCWYRLDPEQAIAWFKKTLALKSTGQLLPEMAKAANNTGTLYNWIVVPDSAGKYLEMALAIDTKRKNEAGIYKTTYDLGVFYSRCDQYILALRFLKKVYDHYLPYPDTTILINTMNAIGNVYYKFDSTRQAVDFYQQGLNAARRRHDRKMETMFCVNLTAAYCVSPPGIQNTLLFGNTAMALAKELNDRQTMLSVNANIGNVYLAAFKPDSALVYLKEAEKYIPEVELPDLHTTLWYDLGQTYLLLGNHKLARMYLTKSLDMATETESPSNQRDALLVLASLDSLEGNFQQAFLSLRMAKILQDSILGSQSRTRIAEFTILFDTQKKENEIARLEQISKFNRWLITVGLLIALMTVGLLISLALYFRKRKKVAEQQLALKHAEAERLEALMVADKRELTGKIQSLMQAEHVISELKTEMKGLVRTSKIIEESEILPALRKITAHDQRSALWNDFEKRFNELHNGFISRLIKNYPTLSSAEVRLCAMLHLQLSGKEIAELINRSTRTIDFTRNSIRKKMGLAPAENLTIHLLNI